MASKRSGTDDEQAPDLPDQGIVKQESYFEQHYELLKIEVLKRLKKDLHLQSVKWHSKQDKDDFAYFVN